MTSLLQPDVNDIVTKLRACHNVADLYTRKHALFRSVIMIQELVNSVHQRFYPRFLVLYRIHLMFEANREGKRELKREEKQRKKYEKWYAKHGAEYEAEQARKREEQRRQDDVWRERQRQSILKREKEKEETRVREQKRLEEEARREVEAKLKRKTLRPVSPRLLALRRKRLHLEEELQFELYATGFDSGDTGHVPASTWIRANAA